MAAAKENLIINTAQEEFRPTVAKMFRNLRAFQDLLDVSHDLMGLLEARGVSIPKTIAKRLESLSKELDDEV